MERKRASETGSETHLVADEAADLAESARLVLIHDHAPDLAREQDVRSHYFLAGFYLQKVTSTIEVIA